MRPLPLLQDKLDDIPSLIARKGTIVEGKRETWKILEIEYDRQCHKLYIIKKAEYPKATVMELEALVGDDDKLFDLRLNMVKKEAEYRLEATELNALEKEMMAIMAIIKSKLKEPI